MSLLGVFKVFTVSLLGVLQGVHCVPVRSASRCSLCPPVRLCFKVFTVSLLGVLQGVHCVPVRSASRCSLCPC